MRARVHGGHCCGIRHIQGFPLHTEQAFKTFVEVDRVLSHKLVEVVLTTRKVRWHDAIKTVGYKEVNRFRNPATGNTCVIYHRQPRSNNVNTGEEQW